MTFQLIYGNQGAIRNLPLKAQLAAILEKAANASGIDAVRVVSGGQAGRRRTGSHRHDFGGAGDIQLEMGGRTLDMSDPNDLPHISAFLNQAHQLGATGIGAGSDYMGNRTFHVGFGTPAVWGAGGSSANAPNWLRQALAGPGAPAPVTPSPVLQASTGPSAGSSSPDNTAEDSPMAKLLAGLTGKGSGPSQETVPEEAQTSPPAFDGGGGIGAQNPVAAAQLLTAMLDDHRKRYGLSLSGMV